MSLVTVLVRSAHRRVTRWILGLRVRARFPGLTADPTVIWDYGFKDLDVFEFGEHTVILPHCEILAYKTSRHSSVPGRFMMDEHSILSTGCNVRAAGGEIYIGRHSAIGQHCVLVAANHKLIPGTLTLRSPWDEVRTGVYVGHNVWVGANCVLLPGTRIGDNSMIAAGSVVRGEVPGNEVWGGVPARRIRAIDQGS